MKVSIEISEIQFLKVLALSPANNEQSEAVLAKFRETPEIDLTEKCRNDPDFSQLNLAVSALALSVIAEKIQS